MPGHDGSRVLGQACAQLPPNHTRFTMSARLQVTRVPFKGPPTTCIHHGIGTGRRNLGVGGWRGQPSQHPRPLRLTDHHSISITQVSLTFFHKPFLHVPSSRKAEQFGPIEPLAFRGSFAVHSKKSTKNHFVIQIIKEFKNRLHKKNFHRNTKHSFVMRSISAMLILCRIRRDSS